MSDTLLRSSTLAKWTTRLKPALARKRVFEVLEGQATDARAKSVMLGLTVLISLNILAVILESMPGVGEHLEPILSPFEAFSVAVFTLEYALRLWSCSPEPLYRDARARLKYAMRPLALVDLAVILPAYLPWELFVDLRFARVLRLVRIFRLFKVARYSKAVRMFLGVLSAKRADLGLIGLLLALIVVLASSSMYFAEFRAQPEVFRSIPAAMWWTVQTLTTVGYGDMYPVTPVGRLLGAVIALVGIGFFALPAGILASGFAEELDRERKKKRSCPRCGKELTREDWTSRTSAD